MDGWNNDVVMCLSAVEDITYRRSVPNEVSFFAQAAKVAWAVVMVGGSVVWINHFPAQPPSNCRFYSDRLFDALAYRM
jgi:hypothetical protein